MIKLYKHIETLWFQIHQKIRFLMVGGFNTLCSYLLFIFLFEYVGFSYPISLIIQYLITINLSIFTMRYYVFQSCNPVLKEYSKSGFVYLLMLMFNYLSLFLMINILNINTILAQGIYTAISTVVLFIIHKNITYKKY